MGILKICSYDVKKRKNEFKNRSNFNSIQNNVRIVFKAYIPTGIKENGDEDFLIIQNETDPIRCGN